jgi:hypothetical protein
MNGMFILGFILGLLAILIIKVKRLPPKFKFENHHFDGCWHKSKAVTYEDTTKRANSLIGR